MARFATIVAFLSRVSGVLAAAMIVLAVLIVCEMVFARYVLGHSTIWQTPFSTFLLVGATFLGSPYVLLTKGHVNVDVLPLYLPQRARYLFAIISALIAIAFCLVVLWKGTQFWWEVYERRWMSNHIWRVPLWVPYLSLPLGMLIFVLQYVADIWALVTGRELPFGLPPREARG